MEWARYSPEFKAQVAADGGLIPTPEIPADFEGVWRAWHRLHLDRPWRSGGFGPPTPGPIPWRDVLAWCDFHGVEGADVAMYDACVIAMDSVFMERHAIEAKQAAAAAAARGKG